MIDRSTITEMSATVRVIARVSAAVFLLGSLTAAAFAQSQPSRPQPGPEQTAHGPALEPAAVEILKAASAALAGANTLSFTAVSTYERAARNGQPLYYSSVHKVTMQRPDKLRVITPGDGTPDEFYYDGKTMMAYVPSSNLVAVAEAPPTIDKLIDEAWDKAAIYFPFSDIIASDPYAELSKTLKSAFYVGRSIAVGGVTTDMVALAGDDVAAELWVSVDDHLPRLVRVVYANEPAHARYQTEFSNWKLNEHVPPGTFMSEKAAAGTHIAFAPPGDTEPQKPAGKKHQPNK
jgi:hypothetical protein